MLAVLMPSVSVSWVICTLSLSCRQSVMNEMRATSLGRTTVPSALSIAKRSTSTFSSLTSRMRR